MKATKSNFADLMAIARAREAEQDAVVLSSPVTQISQVRETGHVRETSPVKSPQEGMSETGHVTQTGHIRETALNKNLADFAESQDYGKGHLRLNHDYLDKVLTLLDAHEQLLFIHLLRYRKGTSETTVLLNFPLLSRRTRLSQSTLNRAAKSLEDKGLIKREAYSFGRGQQQGITFRLVTPTSLVTETSHVRQTSPVTQTDINNKVLIEHTNTDARVYSRFTLAECRRYVDSQPREGIRNAQGLAVSLHRSGEADDAIAAFLAPAEPFVKVDSSACPDCHGTGFYEPGGAGKGVAKCKHERLLETK